MGIKIVLLLLIAVILWRVIDRYTRKQIRLSELFSWVFFWLVSAGFVLWPEASSRLAELVGVGRGVDVMLYLALLLVFYLLFKIFVKFEKIEREITLLARRDAIEDQKKHNDSQ